MACGSEGNLACAKVECLLVLKDSTYAGKLCLAIVSKDDPHAQREYLEEALSAFKQTPAGRNLEWSPKVAAAEKLKGQERQQALIAALYEQVTAEYGASAYIKDLARGKALLADLERRAEAGDAEAQYALGEVYYDGTLPGIPKNYQVAVQWFSRAAASGHARAAFGMALAYDNGRGVPNDDAQAVVWYRRAAEKGVVDAQFNLATMLSSGSGVPKNIPEAINWYLKAAEGGSARAQNELGARREYGEGLPKDIGAALAWYRKSAQQGHPMAQTNLGRLAQFGIGMPKDHAEAARWYELAVRQSHAQAQWRLAYLLENGWGTPVDTARALKLYQAAGAAGESTAWYNLGSAYAEGKTFPVNGSMAVQYLTRAAEMGHLDAMTDLGLLYSRGKLIGKDSAKAVSWYRKAAELGHAMAQNNLGAAYHNGDGLTANSASAVYWYAKSAQQGNDLAVENLAKILPMRAVSTVVSSSANVRARPSTDAATLMSLPRGSRVYPTDDPASGWKEIYVERGHLIGYVSSNLIAPVATTVAQPAATPSNDLWPARPAPKPGFVTCNTTCQNGDCRRTYSDGRKVRFQAKQVWNSFSNQFEWDSGGC
jgi:TPR repeat protein